MVNREHCRSRLTIFLFKVFKNTTYAYYITKREIDARIAYP